MLCPSGSELYIGLMSGTSLDGVDGVLLRIPSVGIGQCHTSTGVSETAVQVLASASLDMPCELRGELLRLNTPGGQDELHRAALAANALTRLYAQVVLRLLDSAGVPPEAVAAIGSHGQTLRHQPGLHDGTGYTLQIQNPALLAELCGICVVADLRSRDVAAGGQGAPLVPAFHAHMFARPEASQAVLNIGGMANVTLMAPAGSAVQGDSLLCAEDVVCATRIIGFDCGPGNALLDWWCQQHTGQPYDWGGQWAAAGRVHSALLTDMLADAFFSQPPPKSTGRDYFHPDWLQQYLAPYPGLMAQDVQATLAALTARSCANSLVLGEQCLSAAGAAYTHPRTLLVCGGGALNTYLMDLLAQMLPGVQVESTAARGMPPQQVEAAAFAWLARQCLHREPANLCSVTGARGLRVLGAVYPA